MIDILPQEILNIIIAQLVRKRDVFALCRVSRLLYKAALPLLYESFVFPVDEGCIRCIDFTAFDLACQNAQLHLALVKEVHFVSVFHNILEKRCPHWHDIQVISQLPAHVQGSTQLANDAPSSCISLGEKIRRLLEAFERNRLRSLSWNVGTCIPEAVINSRRIVQNNIQNLSLITDGSCKSSVPLKGLLKLKRLQTFAWQGLPTSDNLVDLKKCLKSNANHLRALRLNFISWHESANRWLQAVQLEVRARSFIDPTLLEYDAWDPDAASLSNPQSSNFFARCILDLQAGLLRPFFPRLTRLSLSCVSFKSMAAELACALNFSNLRHLSLWKCPATLDLLAKLVSTQQEINLLSLELVISHCTSVEERITSAVSEVGDFLGMFGGLEDLFLMLPTLGLGELECEVVVNGFYSHLDSLKRAVYHSIAWPESGTYALDDVPPWIWLQDSFLQGPKLQCVGLSTESAELIERTLMRLTPRPIFQILHIRASRDTDERDSGYDQGLVYDDTDEEKDEYEYGKSLLGVWNSLYPLPPEFSDNEDTEYNRETEVVPRALLKLAQWAFGPDGLPNLRLLAYGDFSYQERYCKYTSLLCKSECSTICPEDVGRLSFRASIPEDLTFRRVEEYDTTLRELLTDNLDMLSACPVDNVVGPREGVYEA